MTEYSCTDCAVCSEEERGPLIVLGTACVWYVSWHFVTVQGFFFFFFFFTVGPTISAYCSARKSDKTDLWHSDSVVHVKASQNSLNCSLQVGAADWRVGVVYTACVHMCCAWRRSSSCPLLVNCCVNYLCSNSNMRNPMKQEAICYKKKRDISRAANILIICVCVSNFFKEKKGKILGFQRFIYIFFCSLSLSLFFFTPLWH